MTDVLADARSELLREGLDADRVARAIARVRQRWGGAKTYVRSTDRDSRDAEIRAALDSGHPVEQAAERAQCSPSTIRRRRSDWL